MLIHLEKVRKSFRSDVFSKKKEVLKGISFEIYTNRATGLIGVNGSGKTTTLKCMLGFLDIDQGQISYNGGARTEFCQHWGYLPERPYFYEFLTANEFLQFHWKLAEGQEGFADRCAEVLARVNLAGTGPKKLREFSKGMLQRIGIAQALLMRPQILILDEPMSGLDPDGRVLVKDILLQEKRSGTGILMSSHLLSDIEEICSELVIIEAGEILYKGSLIDFLNQSGFPGVGLERRFSEVLTEYRKEKGIL